MAVSVVPWATVVLIVSIFTRGDRIYWLCAGLADALDLRPPA